MCAMRTLLPLCRRYTTTTSLRSNPLHISPAPPRLPKEEQELFERLQHASAGAFSTPKPVITTNPSISSASSPSAAHSSSPVSSSMPSTSSLGNGAQGGTALHARIEASPQGGELHPDIRRGARPEFEGDKNPKTGEVGGPKNEPLRWGAGGDWSYNGRATDF